MEEDENKAEIDKENAVIFFPRDKIPSCDECGCKLQLGDTIYQCRTHNVYYCYDCEHDKNKHISLCGEKWEAYHVHYCYKLNIK